MLYPSNSDGFQASLNFFTFLNTSYSTLSGGDDEEGEHGVEGVVVVEWPQSPLSLLHPGRFILTVVDKILTVTFVGKFLCLVGTVEKFSIEELDSNDTENKLEQEVDDQDVEDVLQGIHDAVEDSLEIDPDQGKEN